VVLLADAPERRRHFEYGAGRRVLNPSGLEAQGYPVGAPLPPQLPLGLEERRMVEAALAEVEGLPEPTPTV
jgi:hypothetical protein